MGKTMITEQGVVQSTKSGSAWVKVQRSEACHHCESQGLCRMLSSNEMIVEASNELGARTGDRVEIGLPTGSFLTLSLVVYFIPVVALVIGAALGWSEAPRFGYDSTWGSAFCGAAFLAAAFLFAKVFERKAGMKKRYQPRITRILPGSPPFPPADDSR